MFLLTFQQTPESLSGKSLEGSLSNSSKLSADDEPERTANSAPAPDVSTKEIKLEKETNRSSKTPSKVISNDSTGDLIKKEFSSGSADHHRPSSAKSVEEIKHESKPESNHVSTSSSLTGSSLTDPLLSSRMTASQQPPSSLPPLPTGLPPFLPPTGLSQVPLFDPLFASNSKYPFFIRFVQKGFH